MPTLLLLPSVSRAGAGGPSADGVSLPAGGTAQDLASSPSLGRFDARTGSQSDVVFGRNSPGPYTLSWKNIRVFSETVVCDGRTLRRDVDYDFDPDAGTIQFHTALASGQVASVAYLCDTINAEPNPANPLPFQWDMWQRGQNSLALHALYRPEDAANAKTTDPSMLTALVYQGGLRLSSSSELTLKTIYDLRGGSLWDRNALQFGEKSHWKAGAFGVTYTLAGPEFAQAAGGLAPGQAIFASNATVNALPNLAIGGTVTQTQILPDKSATTAVSNTTVLDGSVTLTLPKSAGKLEAEHSQTVTVTSSTSTTETTALHLDTTPLAHVKQLKFQANLEEDQTSDSLQRKREFLVNLPPLPFAHTQLSGGVRMTSDPTHSQTVGVIDTITHPFRYVQVSGGARLRDGSLTNGTLDPTVVDTYTANVAFAPSSRLKLTGGYAFNPESSDGTAQQMLSHSFGLETDLGSVHLRGSYRLDNQYLANELSRTRELGLDLRLSRWDMLTTGYSDSNTFSTNPLATTTYLLGFTHKFGSAFDLSLNGSLTLPGLQSVTSADSAELKGEAKIGLRF